MTRFYFFCFTIFLLIEFQFVDEKLETFVLTDINLRNPKMNNNTNNYAIQAFETFNRPNNSTSQFGIKIYFGRNYQGINGILISYHMICAILVLLASINFLFEPRDTNRSCMLIKLDRHPGTDLKPFALYLSHISITFSLFRLSKGSDAVE